MKEEWVKCDGYPNHEVSNKGRIRSVYWGKKRRKYQSPRLLKGTIDSSGYYRVFITNGVKCKSVSIHRLVALGFIPNPKNKRCVNHKNGIKTDNRVENLEWVTYSENTKHAYGIGLMSMVGENHSRIAVTEGQVGEIRDMRSGGAKIKAIANKYGISRSTVSSIVNGRNWSHLNDRYSPITFEEIFGRKHKANIEPEKVKIIRDMRRAGISLSVVKKSLGLSIGISSICEIAIGKTYSDLNTLYPPAPKLDPVAPRYPNVSVERDNI